MRKLPDTSNLNTPKERANWTQIRGAFILMSPEEFGKGSYRKIGEKLGVGKSSLESHSKMVDPSTKMNWWQEREALQSEINKEVTQELVKTQSAEKIDLIKQAKKIKGLIAKKALVFLESDDFVVSEENLIKLLDIDQKYGMNIAKMSGVVDTGGSKAYTFNINIPRKYLNAEGRSWLRNQLESPSIKPLDVDYTVIEDEEQMKQRELKKQ